MQNKIGIKNLWWFTLLWLLLLAGCGATIMLLLILFYIDPSKIHRMDFSEKMLILSTFAIYFGTLIFWRLATFRRKDFIHLAENIGVKLTRRYFYFWVLETHRYVDGFLNDIYVIARMDFPFWAFSPTYHDAKGGGRNYSIPNRMKEEACVALYLLIEGPYNINDEIKIDGEKKQIPTTECPEINRVLVETLSTVSYFHARLQFNKDCLTLSIIGGSWEGRRFGAKIEKGFELFQKLDTALKAKYPTTDWNKWQVAWHYAAKYFYLESKENSNSLSLKPLKG